MEKLAIARQLGRDSLEYVDNALNVALWTAAFLWAAPTMQRIGNYWKGDLARSSTTVGTVGGFALAVASVAYGNDALADSLNISRQYLHNPLPALVTQLTSGIYEVVRSRVSQISRQ